MTEARRKARELTGRAAAEVRESLPEGMQYLKTRREITGLTQRQAADKIGCRHGTYRNWEEGICWPNAFWLPLLAETLHCSIEELFLPPEEQ